MRIGLVGDPDDALRAALDGADVVDGSAADVVAAAPEWIVAVGEGALLAVARAGPEVPVLPVDAGAGVRSVPRPAAPAAVDALLDGAAEPFSRVTLDVAVDGESVGPAVFDVLLTAAEPAHISEFSVHDAGARVGRFRADGVVVATPAGSVGYADAAGGPHVAAGTGVLAVVPVAPFATDADHWVVGDDRVEVRPERSVPVSLVVDATEWGKLPPDATVTVAAGGELRLASTPQSGSAADGRELEKL